MEKRGRLRVRFVGVAVGILAALLVWPATRWLVCAQIACLVPGRASAATWASGLAGFTDPEFGAAALAAHKVASTLPDDYAIQLADTMTAPSTEPITTDIKVARLRDLAKRFPDRPSIVANILRIAMRDVVTVQRAEEELIAPSAPEHDSIRPQTIDPALLAAFDQDAATGERLDPDNAYFPIVRAAALFTAHKDTEALAALHRAAQKPLWTEYYDDELQGEWRLMDRVFGESGALPRIGTGAALLFPQYSRLRSVARMAVVRAMQAEQSGHLEQGIAIREDLLRCGGLIRAEARSMIGSLVGSAMAMIALQRPDGAALLPAPHADSLAFNRDRLRERLVEQYDAFLRRAGHPEQSTRAHAEAGAAAQVFKVAHHSADEAPYGPMLWQIGFGWWAGLQLLCAALWTLAIGAAAALAYRNRRPRSGQGLPASAGLGTTLGILAAVLSGVIAIPAAQPPPVLWLTCVVGFAILALALSGADRGERRRTLSAYAIGLITMAGCMALFAWHAPATADPMRKLALYLYGLSTRQENNPSPAFRLLFVGSTTADLIYHMATLAATAAVPLLAALSFAFISRVSGVPLSVALIRGFRGCAVPIACVLILAYAVVTTVTIRLESAADDAIRQTLRHEGRYVAGLAGKEWPGRIP